MPLDAVENHWVGNTQVQVVRSGAIEDIGRRIRDGDPTLGWEGDPSLSLQLAVPVDHNGNPTAGRPIFEVWALDAEGEPYPALRWSRCDASLIRRLAEIDTRKRDVVADIEKHNRRVEAAARADYEAAAEERGDKLHHALLKDVGAHVGGTTKRIH